MRRGRGERRLRTLSRRVAFLLRHGGDAAGVPLRADGCAETVVLLAALKATAEELESVVRRGEKRRFEFVEGGRLIRARNGHSLAAVQPEHFLQRVITIDQLAPFRVLHGTSMAALPSILANGLSPMRRQHVHFHLLPRDAKPMHLLRGRRDCLVEVDAEAAFMNGYTLFVEGDYLLCLGLLSPAFFLRVLDRTGTSICESELIIARRANLPRWLLALSLKVAKIEKDGSSFEEIVEVVIVPVCAESSEIREDLVFHCTLQPMEGSLNEIAANMKIHLSLSAALQLLETHLHMHAMQEGMFITFGNEDLGERLPRETKQQSIDLPSQLRRYIDLKEFLTTTQGPSSPETDTQQQLELELQEQSYDTMHAAKCIANVVGTLLKRGRLFTTNYARGD